MPIDFVPILMTLIVILLPVTTWRRKGWGPRPAIISFISIIAIFFTCAYFKFFTYYALSKLSNDKYYDYYCSIQIDASYHRINKIILFPNIWNTCGFYKLKLAAELGYPPAMWLYGARLKHNSGVPRNYKIFMSNMKNNKSRIDEIGQKYINLSKHLGYNAPDESMEINHMNIIYINSQNFL